MSFDIPDWISLKCFSDSANLQYSSLLSIGPPISPHFIYVLSRPEPLLGFFSSLYHPLGTPCPFLCLNSGPGDVRAPRGIVR